MNKERILELGLGDLYKILSDVEIEANLKFFEKDGLTLTQASHLKNVFSTLHAQISGDIEKINLRRKIANIDGKEIVFESEFILSVEKITEKIEKVSEFYGVSAFFGEVIKAHKYLTESVRNSQISKFMEEGENSDLLSGYTPKKLDLSVPIEDHPVKDLIYSEKNNFDRSLFLHSELNMGEIADYYINQAKCAYLSSLLGKDGILFRISNESPNKIIGEEPQEKGDILYTKILKIEDSDLEKYKELFKKIQKDLRDNQKLVNSQLARTIDLIVKDTDEKSYQYSKKIEEYRRKKEEFYREQKIKEDEHNNNMKILLEILENRKRNLLANIGKLKISVPQKIQKLIRENNID